MEQRRLIRHLRNLSKLEYPSLELRPVTGALFPQVNTSLSDYVTSDLAFHDDWEPEVRRHGSRLAPLRGVLVTGRSFHPRTVN